MRKIMLSSLLFLLFSTSAHSNELDFGTMPCGEYIYLIERLTNSNNMKTASGILMWLYGYGSSQSNVTVFTNEKFRKFANTLGTQCSTNKTEKLLVMVKKIGVN